jgi:hypothetical protein
MSARQILMREATSSPTDFEVSAITAPEESNSSIKSQQGSSDQQVFHQLAASTSPQATAAERTDITEALSPKTNPSNIFAEPGKVFVQPTTVPRLDETAFSQRPANAKPTPRDASPRLTIHRLDIQIVDQAPLPPIVAPVLPVAQPDSAENFERYQLGHIHLIF